MKIGEKNYIQQLQLHNEKALMYVIDEYGGGFDGNYPQTSFQPAGKAGRML